MNKLAIIVFAILFTAISIYGQGKGVDKSAERVRDNGINGTNSVKTTNGAGRGRDFGGGRTPEVPPIPNPYRFVARRDALLSAIAEVMSDRKLILDEVASKSSDGIVVSQPYTFIKGAVVTQGELGRYADITNSTSRGWTRGRYTLTVEVQPIDGTSANVSVNARIEGRSDGATGAEWTTVPTSGLAEQEFLSALITKITGSPPPGHIE
ncbi:MAG TPA: hypothetical protein VLL54_04595 [Pyrinomonadaceae bacterium]|nr:hypothetical protein [Pyrinomonadaceae bacterium]